MSHHHGRRPDARAGQIDSQGLLGSEFDQSTPTGDDEDDGDPLADFDPDSDASCWDPGELELEETELDEHDFCWDDADRDDD